MNRTQGILTAGTLTLVVAGAVTVFGRLNPVSAEAGDAAPTPAPQAEQVVQGDTQEAALLDQQALLLEQQRALKQELLIMQEREAEYNAEIEAANDTIAELTATLEAGESANEAELANARQTIEQLQASLAVMQGREAEYAAQIEAANQSILTLQTYIDNMPAAQPAQPAQVVQPAAQVYDDDDHYEDDDDDHDDDHEDEDEDDDDD